MISIKKESPFIEKVRETIINNNLLQEGDRVLVGVSGGVDSLSLFHALLMLKTEWGIEICAGHLNHGFREDAREDLEFVRSLAKRWKVPFYGASINVPYYSNKMGLSSQQAARYFRFQFFLKGSRYFRANKIALGHHQDDQVETVLLNILNGTGLEGLAGMKANRRWKGLTIIRPLLYHSKTQILNYCKSEEIEYREDSSNLKTIYQRNKIRLELLPYLKEYNYQIDNAILRLSALAREDDNYLQKKAEKYLKICLVTLTNDKVVLNANTLKKITPALQRRVIRKTWQKLFPEKAFLGFKHIEAIIWLYQKGEMNKLIILPNQVKVCNRPGGRLVFLLRENLEAEKSFAPRSLNVPGKTFIPGIESIIETEIKKPAELKWPPAKNREAYLDLEKINLPLKICSRWRGARFSPLGMENGTKKIKDYFIDKKIPHQKRDVHPLVLSGGEIAWVVGMEISHRYRVTESTRCVLVLKFSRAE